MIFKNLQAGKQIEDFDFNLIYPPNIRRLADFHFTPVRTAQKAAKFLVKNSKTRVLDIGSGAGKFCMIGAACTNGHFTGIEQRNALFSLSDSLLKKYQLPKLKFIHSNIVDVDFRAFDAFYLFNSFYENLDKSMPIDNSVELSRTLYFKYTQYVRDQLDEMPIGTRLVTYFCYFGEIPKSYQIHTMSSDGRLVMWEKQYKT